MSNFIFLAFGVLLFSFGFVIGSKFRMLLFQNQDWIILKWNPKVFGYRPELEGSLLYKKDKVIMALTVDTSEFPEEGLEVEGDERVSGFTV